MVAMSADRAGVDLQRHRRPHECFDERFKLRPRRGRAREVAVERDQQVAG